MAMDYSYSIGETAVAVGTAVPVSALAQCKSGSGECGWIRTEITVNGILVGYSLSDTLYGGDSHTTTPGDKYYSRDVGDPPAIFTDRPKFEVSGGDLVFKEQGEYDISISFENINNSSPEEIYGGTIVVSDPDSGGAVPQVSVSSCSVESETTVSTPATVSVTLANDGGADGSGTVNIYDQDGLLDGEFSVTVPAGGSTTVDFEVVYDTPGEYSITSEYVAG